MKDKLTISLIFQFSWLFCYCGWMVF